jgi:hypothetical protein
MIEEKHKRRPVIDPLLLVLKSRRVVVALAALIVGALVAAVPELETVQGELLTLVISLAFALIGGYTIEDATRIGRETQPPDTLHATVSELVEALLAERQPDEVLKPKSPPTE